MKTRETTKTTCFDLKGVFTNFPIGLKQLVFMVYVVYYI